jgi:hypothetical protein
LPQHEIIGDPVWRAVVLGTILIGCGLLVAAPVLGRLRRGLRRTRARQGLPPLAPAADRLRRVELAAWIAGALLLGAGFLLGKVAPRVAAPGSAMPGGRGEAAGEPR